MAEYFIKHTHTSKADTSGSYDINDGMSYQVGIVMPVYDRYWLLKRCINSLAKSDLPNSIIVFANDASKDPRIVALINSFTHKDATVMVISRQGKTGLGLVNSLHHNLQFAARYLLQVAKCQYLCILDSDTCVKPSWLHTELSLYQELEDQHPNISPDIDPGDFVGIVSGFNTLKYQELSTAERFCKKAFLGGVNMLFNRKTFLKLMLPLLPYWDDYVNSRAAAKGYPRICTRPSVVQHLGFIGAFGSVWDIDFSYNYIRPYSLWVTVHLLHRGIRWLVLLINDKIRYPLKRSLARRQSLAEDI